MISMTRCAASYLLPLAAGLALAGCGADASAASPPLHPLATAADQCGADAPYATFGDNYSTLELDAKGQDDSDGLTMESIRCVLAKLGVTDAVLRHMMDQTRALDGMQSDEWDGYKARWTFAPGSGLTVVIAQT